MSHPKNPHVAAVYALLAETWPNCFSIYEGRRRPLKIGIHHDILAALDGAVSAEELSEALRCYVSNRVYRSRLIEGATRIDLDGQPTGKVTEKDALAAKPKAAKRAPAAAIPTAAPVKRLGLADLRAAAQARKAVAEAAS